MAILEIQSISKYFGGLTAIDDLDLEIKELEIRGIIGPNGAGKTTLFNIISGFFSASKGRVIFRNEDITNVPMYSRVMRGIARTFQLTNVFMDLTVYENVHIGYHRNYRSSPINQFLHTSTAREDQKICDERSSQILEFMGLSSLKGELARNLPYGLQRSLGMGIALATRPSLLLLDEPVAGMNMEETIAMVELIRRVSESGVTILLVEHDMTAVMNLCKTITVLENGKKLAEGSPEEIRSNEKVIDAYLGREEE